MGLTEVQKICKEAFIAGDYLILPVNIDDYQKFNDIRNLWKNGFILFGEDTGRIDSEGIQYIINYIAEHNTEIICISHYVKLTSSNDDVRMTPWIKHFKSFKLTH